MLHHIGSYSRLFSNAASVAAGLCPEQDKVLANWQPRRRRKRVLSHTPAFLPQRAHLAKYTIFTLRMILGAPLATGAIVQVYVDVATASDDAFTWRVGDARRIS